MRKNERRANHTIIAHSVDSTFIHQDVQETAQEIFFLRFQPLCLVHWCWAGIEAAAAVWCTMWREDLLWLVLVLSLPPPEGAELPLQHSSQQPLPILSLEPTQCLYRVHQSCSAWNMEARGFWYRNSGRFYHFCHDMTWATEMKVWWLA